MPPPTLAVSSTSATVPEPRVAYHHTLGELGAILSSKELGIAAVSQALNLDGGSSTAFWFRRRDGSLMPALVAVGSLTLPSPFPPSQAAEGRERAMLLIVTDLTAQKRSEEVEAAETFARAIVEQATDAVVVCQAGGRITKASFAAERLLGESLKGKLLADALEQRQGLSGDLSHRISRLLSHRRRRLQG